MPLYDKNNMDRMRMDAVRRSQEMHRRSGNSFSADLSPQNEEISGQKNSTGLSEIINKLTSDKDVLLIAAVLWLLYKEGADIKLLLALAYILL